ncbi:MAG: DUF1207 domain-containing protein [Calditrichaeota bacterium]|nr:MAG: DUF1207 domain-containing protein [Calditrichota bacterium]
MGRKQWFCAVALGVILGAFLAGPSVAGETGRELRQLPRFVADPFEPRMGLAVAPGKNDLIGRIGARMPLLRRKFKMSATPVTLTGGLAAYSWTWLGRRGSTFPVRAVDYLLGAYGQLYWKRWQARLALNHISAHLGDGFFSDLQRQRRPITYSREYLQFSLHRGLPRGELYGTVQWAYHAIPRVNRWELQFGGSGRLLSRGRGTIYLAAHLAFVGGFPSDPRWNLQLGLHLPLPTPGRAMRWALEWQSGPQIFGQFFDQHTRRLSLGFFIDW